MVASYALSSDVPSGYPELCGQPPPNSVTADEEEPNFLSPRKDSSPTISEPPEIESSAREEAQANIHNGSGVEHLNTVFMDDLPRAKADPRRKLIDRLNGVGLLTREKEERRRQVRDLKDYPDIAALADIAKKNSLQNGLTGKENFYEIMGSPKVSPASTSAGPASTKSTASPDITPLPRNFSDPPVFDLNTGTDADAFGFAPFSSLPPPLSTGVCTPPLESSDQFGNTDRSDLLWNLAGNGSPDLKPLESDEMETDGSTKTGVYLLSSPKLGPCSKEPFQSIFKPLDEEVFERRGIELGMGALREEAAFVIDRATGGQAFVPVTARASLEEGGVRKKGSVQQFVAGSVGPVENFGMPRDLETAEAFVGLDNAQAVACFDIRVFNTDRHAGNLLLAGPRPHKIVCIDHGCVLPAWWALDSSRFDAWLDWSPVKAPPSPATLNLISQVGSSLPLVVQELDKLALPKQAIWTLEICTSLLQKCVLDHGLTLRSVALLMTRLDPSEPCWLERQVAEACREAGVSAEFIPDDKYGDPMLLVDPKITKLFTASEAAAFDNKHLSNFRETFFQSLNNTFAHKDVISAARAAEDAARPPWD
jgi:hypothetical protein|mmetsp:Transcript_109314/g.172258  ORF Transcript_109314/g.172258 Transcript_109314/m.172258 type:complete len:594 (-) Transcript_109314:119-1900(-)